MEKINFQDNVTKANAETMTQFQDNIENAINNLKGTILWKNTNSNLSFAKQTISLLDNIENYDRYEIIYKNWISHEYYLTTGLIPVGLNTRFNALSSTITWRNVLSMSGKNFQFDNGTSYTSYNGSTSEANENCIPVYVIGYKTDLFTGE